MSRFVLQRLETQREYFSAKPVPAANAMGSWSPDPKKALGFSTLVDAIDFARLFLRHDEPYLSYVDISTRDE